MVKTITIREEIYRELLTVKRSNESFSELFDRLVKGGSAHALLLKMRGSVTFSNKKALLKEIRESRKGRRFA